MQVVLIILSIGLLGLIINYAVSSKSSKFLRLAALIALGLIAVSLGVASIIIGINGAEQEAEEIHLPIFLEAPKETPKKGNIVEIIIFLVILSSIVVLIVVVTSRENKKKLAEAKKAGASPIFQNAGKHDDLDLKTAGQPEKAKDDDGFNLELE